MEALDVLKAFHGGVHVGEVDGMPAFMVQGDAINAVHGIDATGVGRHLGPG